MGQLKLIHDVVITPLKRFSDERGMVMHIMKSSDAQFKGFGEVYCSTINPGVIKGWHFHEKITLNYVVLKGMIRFVLYDSREDSPSKNTVQEILLGDENYIRVTVPPGIWSAFKCLGTESAMVCNLIDLPHDDSETKRCDPFDKNIPYIWK